MNNWWSSSTKVRDHRGRWEREPVLMVLNETRMTPENQNMVIEYLCEGRGVSQFRVSRQQVYARVKKIVNILVNKD